MAIADAIDVGDLETTSVVGLEGHCGP